ncbi:MAG: nucleoid-associated protein [Bacteroidales bacterium]|nr:nucleoid-associated protein [Bacteroidales bacterium]
MPVFESSAITSVALHFVGNQGTDEGMILSPRTLPLTEQLQDLFVRYFLTPFKGAEYFNLYHEDDVRQNEVFQYVSNVFDDPENLLVESQHLARCLYNASMHPNIKGGDFFVVYFRECLFEGQTVDAVGLFKSESKESFLKIAYTDEEWERSAEMNAATAVFRIDVDKGININKLDKGALIFNIERDNGFVVSVVDATNRALDARYWRDDFLRICQREDAYYKTHSEMAAYKKFVTDELPQQFTGVSKADQADMLNRSVEYFKQNDSFDVQQFSDEVIGQPEVIESFQQYRQYYQQENAVTLEDQFSIDDSAVKKQARSFKSVIKLDRNFHIYVHGNRELIEQGEDERGKFYKVYYNEES